MIDDLYDEMYEDDDAIVFEKFRPKPKVRSGAEKRTRRDEIRDKRVEKANQREMDSVGLLNLI